MKAVKGSNMMKRVMLVVSIIIIHAQGRVCGMSHLLDIIWKDGLRGPETERAYEVEGECISLALLVWYVHIKEEVDNRYSNSQS